jgi:hypothetical protein
MFFMFKKWMLKGASEETKSGSCIDPQIGFRQESKDVD